MFYTGLSFFPLLIVGIILEEINLVLIEIPILLFGIAWIGISYYIYFDSLDVKGNDS